MANSVLLLPMVVVVLLLLEIRWSGADMSRDRAECADQLVGLATCLPYVQGGAKSPTPDCCTGLKEVLGKSPKCLCLLIKDRDDPQLGLKINASLALGLPAACSNPVPISECPKILKLPPNSPEAQIFTQPQRAAQGTAANSTAKGNSRSANESSSGISHRRLGRKEWRTVERVGVFLYLLVLPLMAFAALGLGL